MQNNKMATDNSNNDISTNNIWTVGEAKQNNGNSMAIAIKRMTMTMTAQKTHSNNLNNYFSRQSKKLTTTTKTNNNLMTMPTAVTIQSEIETKINRAKQQNDNWQSQTMPLQCHYNQYNKWTVGEAKQNNDNSVWAITLAIKVKN